jgi:hypothetical protein
VSFFGGPRWFTIIEAVMLRRRRINGPSTKYGLALAYCVLHIVKASVID